MENTLPSLTDVKASIEESVIEWSGGGGEQTAVYKGRNLMIVPAGADEYDGYVGDERFCGTDDFDMTADMLKRIVDGTYVKPDYSKPQVAVVPRKD